VLFLTVNQFRGCIVERIDPAVILPPNENYSLSAIIKFNYRGASRGGGGTLDEMSIVKGTLRA
jgi:hypothetical protein